LAVIAYCGPLVVDHLVLIDRLPVRGEFLKGELAGELVGGCMVNSAIQSAQLGAETLLVSKLGDDPRGQQAFQQLVLVPGLQLHFTQSHGTTPLALVLCEQADRTIISTDSGRNKLGLPDDQIAAAISRAGYVMVDIGDQAVCAAYHRLVFGLHVLPLRRLLSQVGSGLTWEIVIGSASDGEPELAQLEACGCRLCVVTTGETGGRYWRLGRDWATFPAVAAAQVVDPTGAGDCFAAGLLAGLDRGLTTEAALALAARCGAEACGFAGGHPR
jgi:ribokinase